MFWQLSIYAGTQGHQGHTRNGSVIGFRVGGRVYGLGFEDRDRV